MHGRQRRCFDELPRIVDRSLIYRALMRKTTKHVETMEDADHLRVPLTAGPVCFIANGSVFKESG